MKNFLIFAGAGYARSENQLRDLINFTGLPFLPTPMGKGVVSDTDERCVSSARTTALLKSDVILLLGARLNWILHFGRPPRFRSDVKIIQVKFLHLLFSVCFSFVTFFLIIFV